MLNMSYRLVYPKIFEEQYNNIDITKDVLVRPTHFSICHADQRYYQGIRHPNILKEKLPMALIHESIGKVIKDNTYTFKKNDRVVMIPNMPMSNDNLIAENYRLDSKFRSSSYDGFMEEIVQIKADRLIKLPKNIDLNILAFTELMSVATHAIQRFIKYSHNQREIIGIWGDGNLSYILALLLSKKFFESKVYVFGKHKEKLDLFSFVNRTFLIDEIPKDLKIDHAFEATGGSGSEVAINQIINYLNPQGSLSLLGVSENKVPINTRLVLEKGVVLFGSSRSGRDDFIKTLEYLEEDNSIVEYLDALITNVVKINSLEDVKKAFDIDKSSFFGKTILIWNR